MNHADDPEGPRLGRAGIDPEIAQLLTKYERYPRSDLTDQTIRDVGADGGAEPADEEAVELRITLDKREIRVDCGAQ